MLAKPFNFGKKFLNFTNSKIQAQIGAFKKKMKKESDTLCAADDANLKAAHGPAGISMENAADLTKREVPHYDQGSCAAMEKATNDEIVDTVEKETKEAVNSKLAACFKKEDDPSTFTPACTECQSIIVAWGIKNSPMPWTGMSNNYLFPAGACLKCVVQGISRWFKNGCQTGGERAVNTAVFGQCTQESVGTCTLLVEAMKCEQRGAADDKATFGLRNTIKSMNRGMHAWGVQKASTVVPWRPFISRVTKRVCNVLQDNAKRFDPDSTLWGDTKPYPNVLKGCMMVRSKIESVFKSNQPTSVTDEGDIVVTDTTPSFTREKVLNYTEKKEVVNFCKIQIMGCEDTADQIDSEQHLDDATTELGKEANGEPPRRRLLSSSQRHRAVAEGGAMHRQHMRDMIHHVLGVRLSLDRTITEQFQAMDRIKAVQDAAQDAAGLAKTPADVMKLNFDTPKDFGKLQAAVSDGQTVGDEHKFGDLYIANQLVDLGRGSKATNHNDKLRSLNLGLAFGFSHVAGCAIYSSKKDQQWVPNVPEATTCQDYDDCGKCASMPMCKFCVESKKCQVKGASTCSTADGKKKSKGISSFLTSVRKKLVHPWSNITQQNGQTCSEEKLVMCPQGCPKLDIMTAGLKIEIK